MDYNALEQELVDAINQYLASQNESGNYIAKKMAETDADFERADETSLILVHYTDSNYALPQNTSAVTQVETVNVGIYISARTLRNDTNGAYKALVLVKAVMLGFRPTNSTKKMYISSAGTWQSLEGGTMPFLEFSFDTKSSQQSDEPVPTGGPLKTVTYQPQVS